VIGLRRKFSALVGIVALMGAMSAPVFSAPAHGATCVAEQADHCGHASMVLKCDCCGQAPANAPDATPAQARLELSKDVLTLTLPEMVTAPILTPASSPRNSAAARPRCPADRSLLFGALLI
jgi:hypothetical protein